MLLVAVLFLYSPLAAQVWNNSTSANWQSDSWSLGGSFPGAASNSLNVFIAPLSNITITDATPPFPIGNLTILATQGTFSVTLNGSGTLVVNGDLTVNNTLVIGSGLRLVVNGSLRGAAPILVSSGASLRLNSTSTTAVESSVRISAPALSPYKGTVELGVGWNGGFLPGAVFGDEKSPFQGSLQIASTMKLSSPLYIGAAGVFDFSPQTNSTNISSGNKLILASSATILGTLINAGLNQFFVTTAFPLTLGNVGNTTFPVGQSTSVFAPLNINNNGSPATFSVQALPFVTQPVPFATGSAVLRQSIVNQQWNVSQLTGITPGFSVTISPLWVAGQENAGFNRAISVVNAFTTTNGTVSSAAGAAASDPNYSGYFRSGVTITQIATNNLNNTPILVSSQPAPGAIIFTPPAQSSGATITITGSRLAPGAGVSIGGVSVPAANVTLISGGSSGIDTLRVVVPSNAASGDITVTQTGGSSTARSYTIPGVMFQQPFIYTVTPNPIPAGLGDVELVINGATFGILTPRVVAAGNDITSTITPSANTTTHITATIPGNVIRNIGSVVFTVTSLDRFPVSTTVTISTAPVLTLTNLTPSVTSSNLQPFTIRVNGIGFSAQSLFTLGKDTLRVMSVLRHIDGSLTAVVEARPGIQSGNLTVTNLNKQAASLPFLVGTVGVLAEAPPQILVFPNPVEDIVLVEAHRLSPGSIFITITNVFGQSMLSAEESVMSGQYHRSFNLSGLPSGVYLLEVRDRVRRVVQKILKK
ncbi:MAG: T9SS type A sorting domain-containing protein [Candidatus Kapabacteria bacterium]|nr:T9SS type A sorting domain-containing protein [Candidatus Kapabacteria bacterium]